MGELKAHSHSKDMPDGTIFAAHWEAWLPSTPPHGKHKEEP